MSIKLYSSLNFAFPFSLYFIAMDPVNRSVLPSMPLITTPFKSDLSDSSMVSLGRLSPLPLCSSTECKVQSTISDVFVSGSSNLSQSLSYNTSLGLGNWCAQSIVTESSSNFHPRRERSTTPPRLLYENNSFVTVCNKKSSPMKIVSPILKKYSSHRSGKNNKKPVSPKSTSLDGPDTRLPSPTPGCSKSPDLLSFNNPYCLENEEELLTAQPSIPPRCPKRKQTQTVNKKKKKQEVKEVQMMLSLLDPDTDASKEEDSFSYAQAFYFLLKDCLETTDNVQLLDEVWSVMAEFEVHSMSVQVFYEKINSLLKNYPVLAEQFLIFLLPEQALECGKFIEHLRLTNMYNFVKKLKIFFAKKPQQIRLVFSALESLSRNQHVTNETVKSFIIPLLKGNTILIDSLLSLLPDERPPNSLMEDFEEMEVDSDHSGNEEEMVDIPEENDPYGTDHCMCLCHESRDEKYNTRHQHCISCGTKFIHGKIYLQTGRSLRPAKISFPGFPSQVHRIYVEVEQKERRRRNTNSPVKGAQTSPNCEDNVSEVEDDSKFLSPKSSRMKSSLTKSASKVRASIMKCVPDNAVGETDVLKISTSSSSEQSFLSDPPSLDDGIVESTNCLPAISSQTESNPTILSLDSNITVINLLETNESNNFSTTNNNCEEVFKVETLMPPDILVDNEECVVINSHSSEVTFNSPKLEDFEAGSIDTLLKDDVLSSDWKPVLVQNESSTVVNKTEKSLDELTTQVLTNTCLEGTSTLNQPCVDQTPVDSSVSNELLDRLVEVSSPTVSEEAPKDSSSTSGRTNGVRPPWTKDEDKVILLEVQRGYSFDKTFQNIRGLPQRSLEEIRERFHMLMKMLQEMPLPKEEESSNSNSSVA